MPILRKHESGAIVFDLTPEEETVKSLTKELQEKMCLLDKKLTQVDNILIQAGGGNS